MPLPTGQWNIVSGGYNGILNITNVSFPGNVGGLPGNVGEVSSRVLFTPPLTVTGTLELEPNVTLAISGTWNEAHQELYFQYSNPPESGQKSYTGYLFSAGQPLFDGPPGLPTPRFHILAGELVYQFPLVLEPNAIAKVIVVGSPVSLFPTVTTGWMARMAIPPHRGGG
jgi:hypothetical protein